MSTYKTKNPLGSAAVKDLYDNAENVDKFVNDRTKEELDDRLGVLRKTWYGMEMIFSRFITYITGRGEQAVGAIGWQELGNWATGLTVDNRQQIVYYNGSWYKYLGELEHVITGDSPENDGGVWSAENPTGKWSNIGDAALRSNLGSSEPGMGDNIITHVPTELDDQITTVNQALSAQAPTIWQYARYVTNKPTTFPSTWDWGPAFQAAHDNDNVGPLLINGETYTVRTPVVYEYTDDDYTKYSRLPRCLSGSASIDYSELGNGGAGFNDSLEVDDTAQPAYVTAFTVKGASGYVVLQEFEGIVFRGNKNTAAIKLIGCDGIRPNRCTFTTNRYGVVFNNGSAAGTYAELNSPTFCRFRGGCLTAIAYEKGGGDTSFHGCGLGEGCFVTVAAGRSPVLIGAGCQPYNAPMNANFWTTGTSAPIIRNKSSLPAHFHGEMKWEGSYGTVMASGGLVYFYGALPRWAGVDKGTLRQARNGGPTGSAGGNLAFSGILDPVTTQWTVASLGTQVVFMDYNEEATVSIVGESYFATFKIQTARRLTNNCTTLPFQLISGNVNPLTKFSITRTSQGLRLTTIEDNTKIVVWRQRGMPDQSSGMNYNVTDHWNSI
ncbi:TPA: hypothetical protein ND549_005827 [Klebsiella michiganensis]|uniref:hypothetical protein n=1 Tax=Klebsiella michiganensis TaxID=1134687 RepID=UPI000FF8F291|nr:hypothetical protein [Klebsiella michiganensis]QAS67051.1 hypothetical protein KOCBH_04606 [Klebsiella michiganensis]HCD5322108.1 hypothetical protein [Klebsiella michiganensis]HCD7244248.1 hypothetical protein [Klebsiella michiganensis]HCD7467779.1 hypothetical protein [Klebsiella michiganensis]HCD7473756.1 hypothetical protein [Klebsiella michiganensis]